jgi:D-sedoheptulose 7-phosphate isomerase
MYREYIDNYLSETQKIIDTIDRTKIEKAIEVLKKTRDEGGRLFILGVGGSAANASHAVNDFRKIAGIETYAPTDNVSELTAWTNDNGFEFIFINWLKTSRLNSRTLFWYFLWGRICYYFKKPGNGYGICKGSWSRYSVSSEQGRRGCIKDVDAGILIPVVADERITPHAEGWQGIVWHLLVNAIK